MRSFILSIAGATLLASCSGSGKTIDTGLDDFAHNQAQADTVAMADSAAEVVLPPVTSQGIGPLRLGMNPARVPQTLPGVYDSLTVTTDDWEGAPFKAIEFYLGGHRVIDAMAIADTTRIDAITLLGGSAALTIDGTRVNIGTRAAALSRLKGIHELPDSPEGARRLEWHGVTLYIDADTVSAITLGEN